MQTARMKGKTVEEAVESALQVLKARPEDVEVKIINEGKTGILGVFGGEEAEVEVMVKGGAGEYARDFLQDILDRMGLLALASIGSPEEDGVALEIKGEDMGRIIGKDGATIDALQIILGTILSKHFGRRVRVKLDAGGYRQKREERLGRLAKETAQEVAATGKEVVLPPMSPADRRAVHLALQESPRVFSYSKGERGERRVVVAPKGKEAEIKGKKESEEVE